MRLLPLILLAASTVTFAQSEVEPSLFKSERLFTSDGKVETDRGHRIESGLLNDIAYRLYYVDGSGSFVGKPGNVLATSEYGSNWETRCYKDSMDDSKSCDMKKGNFWLTVSPKSKRETDITIGVDNFPGTNVAIRIDRAKAIYSAANGNGHFSNAQSLRIIEQLKKGKSFTTNYTEWPYQSIKEATWDVYGFNECFQYITWAVERIK